MTQQENKPTEQQIDDFITNLMTENPVKFIQYCLLVIGRDIHESGADEFKFSSECNVDKENRIKVTVIGKIKTIK